MKFLRSQSQTVLIVILAVIGLGFLFYGNSGSFLTAGGGAPSDFGRIDGETLQISDLYNAVRSERRAMLLNPRQQPPTQEELAESAWARLLLLHEAEKLHIDIPEDPKAADAQLSAFIQNLPQFQTNGAYDAQNLAAYLKFTNMPFNTFAALMQEQMRIEAVYRALFSSIHALAADAKDEYDKGYGPVQLSYVAFPAASFAASQKVTPEEIEAAYKANPADAAYRTAEKRQVEYVLYPLSADQQKLADKDKTAAIQALGQQALDFALALQPDPNAPSGSAPPAADFDAEAKKRGLTPITTDLFSANTPPAGMPPSPAFNNAAFALGKDDPVSKVVQLDNGVVVMRLVQIQPSELRPLAEVTPVIEKELQAQKGTQAQAAAAHAAAVALQDAVKKGTDFKAAAAALHLDVQTVPSFVPGKASMSDMKQAMLGYFSTKLPVGGVSQPIPLESDNSVVVLHVDSRSPADPAGLADFEKNFRAQQDHDLQAKAAYDWVNWENKQPGTHRPPNLEAFGAVQD